MRVRTKKAKKGSPDVAATMDGFRCAVASRPDPVEVYGNAGDVRDDGTVSPATVAALEDAHRGVIAACRADVNEFCAYVGRDEETGEPLVQQLFHEGMHVAADVHPRLIAMGFPGSGKTSQLGILRTLWKLGHNPNLRVVVVSADEDKAKKISRAIRSYIERSKELAEVFPNLLPGDKWEEDFFTVRRGGFSKDATVMAIGMDGTLTGGRVDDLILDDVLTDKNTRSEEERKKVLRRIKRGFLDRMRTDGGNVVFLTNAWHPRDAAHLLEEDGWYVHKVLPRDPGTGELTWPQRFTEEVLAQKRRDLGPLEYARAFECRARDEGENPFDLDAVQLAVTRADVRELDLVYRVDPEDLPPGAAIYTGVDLAVTKKRTSHLTALSTILVWPEDLSRQVLWVESGRWSSAEIRARVLAHDERYLPIFIVENNAAQRWIIDIIMNQADLPEADRRLPCLVPFTTGKNKAHPEFGVEGLAVEVAAEKWFIPLTGPRAAVEEVKELRTDMESYTRGQHVGDRLMATWFAREGARRRVGRDAGQTASDRHGGVKIFEDRPRERSLADLFV